MPYTRVPKELHRKIFELTLALYRVTDFFPRGEVLRRQLREKGNEIFGCIAEYDYASEVTGEVNAILGKIQSLKGYLGIARAMRFIKPINLIILEREYDFVARFFVRDLEAMRRLDAHVESQPASVEAPPAGGSAEMRESRPMSVELNERQKRIIEYFNFKGTHQAKISDLASMFADISTKTVQRDLQDLVTRNILRKEGEKRWTMYALNSYIQ